MPRKERYSVQVEFVETRKGVKKEPFIKNGLTRDQYGLSMKKLWENYILKLEKEVRSDNGDHYLTFTARKKEGRRF